MTMCTTCSLVPLAYVFRFILKESGFPRYLHSAALLSGTLLIFGGNTHNDTSLSNGAKCFSADFLAYDIGKTPDVFHVILGGEQSLLLNPLMFFPALSSLSIFSTCSTCVVCSYDNY